MNVKQIFGENLKYYRKKRGYTQEKLSELLEIGTPHLANIEIGKRFASASLLDKISEALKVPFSALFYTPEQEAITDNILENIDVIINKYTNEIKKDIRESVYIKKK